MKIYVNDTEMEVQPGLTILEFIRQKELKQEMVIIAHNQEIVPREAWGTIGLEAEDRLEVVNFVGGG